jgi:hypothetical protein
MRCWCFVGVAILAGRAIAAQPPTPEIARAFDRADRESRAFAEVLRCGRILARLAVQGSLGPRDSLGDGIQCSVIDGRTVGVFFNLDGKRFTRFLAVDIATAKPRTASLDTSAQLAQQLAEGTATDSGSKRYEQAHIDIMQMGFRFDADSIEIWLVPVSFFAGNAPTLGGEHGYIFSPDGRTLVREVDAFADYRPITVPRTTPITIDSRQDFVPTLTEMTLANMANQAQRQVTIDMRRMTATLVGSGPQSMWIQQKKP